jgi:hypothetical protein
MAGKLSGSAIQSNTITITQIQTTAITNIVTQAGPRVTSLVYPGNDTAGNTVGGQTVYINGSGFETNNAIYINGNAVPSKSFISASNLSFTTPALSSGIYPVYVINTDSGSTAIFIPGYISSAEPTWVTSAGSLNASQDEGSAWSYSLSATGDAPITYALAVGSSLPSGISLASNGVVSGTLSSPPGTETTYTFSVVATDAQNQDSTRQFTVTTTTGEGVLFANNVLLIHADGTNNKNNHAFLDSSNNNFTITRNGNASQGSFSPFSQTGWSNFFDGNGDQLAVNSMTFSANAVTVEAWVYFTADSFGSFHDIFIISSVGMLLDSGKLRFYGFSATTASATITRNKWVHVAVVKESNNTLKGYYDGVECFSTTSSTVWQPSNQTGYIGSWSSGNSEFFPGYISNLRLSNVARYTSNFTPPTSPFSSDANTILLSCQSNRFRDASNNNFTITRNGDVSVQAFSPFAPTAAYSTADVGGSAYFDGTGDYLTLPSSSNLAFGTGDFSVEMWVYFTGSPTGDQLLTNISGSETEFSFRIDASNYPKVQSWFTNYAISNTAVVANQWYHLVACRTSNTLSIFVNGTRTATATVTNNFSSTNAMTIGGASGTEFSGYISSMRITKGSSPYDPTQTTITVPTTPPTNITNTQLLCNFTNAGIFDQTAKNILETVGDAKVSTTQYKYGTASMFFDGTGDSLLIPASKNFAFGTGDFTVEFWMRSTDTDFNLIGLTTAAAGNWNLVMAGSSLYWQSQHATTNLYNRSGTSILDGNWHHIAITRASGTNRMFFDGVLQGSVTSDSTNYTAPNNMQIGTSSTYGDFSGYLDDLRITKGYARYTSNFTPPAAAFKDK